MTSFVNKLNTLIAGPTTTPAIAKRSLPKGNPVSKAQPLRTQPAGTNAQTDQMQKTLAQNNKVQKTYGMPGAK